MFLKEQEVRNDDVRLAQRRFAFGEGGRVVAPFGGGKDIDGDAGEIGLQARRHPCGRACGVPVQRHDDDAIGVHVPVIAHNGPLPRTACRC